MRFIIGIDLGTTNSCVAYVDTQHPKKIIQPFRIPQLNTFGTLQSLATLPSFCYLSSPSEFPNGLPLPWQQGQDFAIGFFAQELGAQIPTRLVQSAKSWLCHSAAARREAILPIEGERRISPIEAAAKYLAHIKAAWNHTFGQDDEHDFDQQEIVLTVPASFDEVARRLTIEAAKLAGYINVTLLEEPQAAFYSWLSNHQNQWESLFKSGDQILVCDVGGGTTDFSLLQAVEKGGKLHLERVAVGDHLLLGGDNMDAALAHLLESKLDRELTSIQWQQLQQQARKAKEQLLSGQSQYQINIQGCGSEIIKGSLSLAVGKSEVEDLLVKGFFGVYPWEQALQLEKTRGLRSMGLPYEDDPSITKHLARFLNQNAARANFLLFNGGTMKAPPFQQAIVSSLKLWFPAINLTILESTSLDLAVARGAAYFGMVRRGLGVKIAGGLARSYYIGIDTPEGQRLMTVLPRGSEEGETYHSEREFSVLPNTPVVFPVFTSHVRLNDRSGELHSFSAEEMQPLPSLMTRLRFGKQQERIPVSLSVHLTTVGTLELWLQSKKTEHRWNLEFQVRAASGQENSLSELSNERTEETVSSADLEIMKNAIAECFSHSAITPKQLVECLEKSLEKTKNEWSVSLLRAGFDQLLKCQGERTRSQEHEIRWWNLIGYFLRPGFGYPLDDHRIKELWKVILSEKSVKTIDLQIQKIICYRRISGGLNKGQQTQLASQLAKNETENKNNYFYSETIRALGSFELLDHQTKLRLAKAILKRIENKQEIEADFWALGRLGARQLIYGGPANVIPKEHVSSWIDALLDDGKHLFLIKQLARKTGQRELNLSQEKIESILKHYQANEEYERLKEALLTEQRLNYSEETKILGDQLPLGLFLNSL